MAAIRRGQGQMRVQLPKIAPPISDLPPISALFLIYFDIKAGYTIGWSRTLPGIGLEGVVEYKSLPSGLHTVTEDLIYFVHDRYAGLSAFASAPASEESRNARMIAVGILVPLSYGRLGRSWKHAEKLKDMAQKLVADPDETKVLGAYWESHKAEDDRKSIKSDISVDSPSSTRFQPGRQLPGWTRGHGRNRSASDGTVLLQPGHSLAPYHPAWSLSALLDLFGPLIFPIHRAALLRRRILIAGHAPVHQTCDFVYDISVLSNIPLAVTDLLAPTAPPQRLRPLFSIGIHDIPFLEDDLKASQSQAAIDYNDEDEDESELSGHGWIACTTDDILAVKSNLYDVLITLPPSHSTDAKEKVWPKIESPRGTEIKATQRDLRRYRALKWGLSRAAIEPDSPSLARSNTANTANGDAFRPSSGPTSLSPDSALLDISDTDTIVEPLSWSALAYSGFMWWASAGERRIATEDEIEHDSILLEGLGIGIGNTTTTDPQTPKSARSRSQSSLSQMLLPQQQRQQTSSSGGDHQHHQTAKREMSIIAYFHRLTTRILTTLSDIIDATDSDDDGHGRRDDDEVAGGRGGGGGSDDDDEIALHDDDDDDNNAHAADDDGRGEDGPLISIHSTDIAKMGLDEWSSSDLAFIVKVAKAYFGHTAQLQGASIDICGIRIC